MASLELLDRILLVLALFPEGSEGAAALKQAMVAQHHYLLGLLRYKTDDEALAEDILQESYLAFLAADPDPRRFADEARLKNYLVTIALNKLRDHWRREGGAGRRRNLFSSREEADEWLESLPAGQADPASRFEDEAESARLRRAIALAMEELPASQRAVLELKFTKELDNRRIAEELGLGIKAVESLLFRAKAGFREAFVKAAAGENERAAGRVDKERG